MVNYYTAIESYLYGCMADSDATRLSHLLREALTDNRSPRAKSIRISTFVHDKFNSTTYTYEKADKLERYMHFDKNMMKINTTSSGLHAHFKLYWRSLKNMGLKLMKSVQIMC